jgi:predicted secreted protein
MKLRIMVVVLLALTAACGKNNDTTTASPTPAAGPAKVEVTKAGNGKTVSLVVEQKMAITLSENAGTGYAWKLTGKPKPDVVKTGSNRYVAPPAPSGAPVAGRPGVHRFSFKAKGLGQTSITIQLYPPARGSKPTETFSIKVNVVQGTG